MILPRVGKKSAKNIADFRALNGNITEDTIQDIRKLTVTDQLLQMVDFYPNPNYVQKSSSPKGGRHKQKSEPPTDPFTNRIVAVINKHIKQERGKT